MAKRAENISSEQKTMLVEFLNKNPKLVSSKFSADFTKKDGQELWERVTGALNAVPGAQKEWKQWRKTWHDMKTKTKQRQATINQSFKKTGGGPPTDVSMTSVDDNIATLIGPTIIHGDVSVNESVADFILSENENSNSSDDDTVKDNVELLASTEDFTFNKNILSTPKDSEKRKLSPKEGITSSKKPRYNGARRLQEALSYTQCLSSHVKEELELKKQYWNNKIELYTRDVVAKERLADAAENLLKFLKDKEVGSFKCSTDQ